MEILFPTKYQSCPSGTTKTVSRRTYSFRDKKIALFISLRGWQFGQLVTRTHDELERNPVLVPRHLHWQGYSTNSLSVAYFYNPAFLCFL